jgi:hypothetical protein
VRKLYAAVLLALLCAHPLIGQEILTNDSVIKLLKAGFSDDVVLASINAKSGQFDTSTDGLITLKAAGASEKVISAMIAKPSTVSPSNEHPLGEPAAPLGELAAPPNQGSRKEVKPQEDEAPSSSGKVPTGARIVIAPMGGFETYFAAAVREKKVPIVLTLDKDSAQFYVVSTNTEWQGFVYGAGGTANWNRSGGSAAYGASGSSTRGLEASIMLIDAKTKDVIWAYEVHKNSHGALIFGTFGARGQQSIAEACAKHLKEYIEKSK